MRCFIRKKNQTQFKSLHIRVSLVIWVNVMKKTSRDKAGLEDQGGSGLPGNSKCLNAMGLCFTGIFITSDISLFQMLIGCWYFCATAEFVILKIFRGKKQVAILKS